ncbi:hypothetical protein [Micromonospora purpureochromogenes]|uniref:RNA-binding Zn-ribbon protein involved in translation (DUF1610 family) n=1 Tax=Micromonospora purpureochromogenes TaxID=47872 RepID=A0ABX2RS23_9ACTN|nr:hypothetical protein [Micromonospora purpureochromogenes]NYF59342.1 putative RNA-binding Zn-ribbon protein involved in translation (DUF1610 family) [Micromonospora purpureochromogenes]
MATFDEWLTAYDVVYRALPAASDLACPNCGHRTLRIVFTARPAAEHGYASFWCDTCLEGIYVSRAPIPAGVTARSTDEPAEDRNRGIPDYRLVT